MMSSPLGTWKSFAELAHLRRLAFLAGMAAGLATAVLAFFLGYRL